MKKILCLLIAVMLVISLGSCGETHTAKEPNESNKDIIIVEPPIDERIWCENYQEYLDFIESTEVPDDFVTYDDIENFGSFQSFVTM